MRSKLNKFEHVHVQRESNLNTNVLLNFHQEQLVLLGILISIYWLRFFYSCFMQFWLLVYTLQFSKRLLHKN